ncbi:MAG: MFS transporter [Candidatus Diapherotrites archaeon]|nr:MFS transporter [Candidatus Diapherotrites archaeon]
MKKISKILLTIAMLGFFAEGLMGPIYAVFVEQIGGDVLTASSSWALYSIVLGGLIFVFGKLEDGFLKKEQMISAGLLVGSIATFSYMFVSEPIHLFLVQAFLGIAAAMVTPAWDSMYSINLDKGKESSEWSLEEGGSQIVLGLSALIGGIIVSMYGFNLLFILMGLLELLAFFLFISIKK